MVSRANDADTAKAKEASEKIVAQSRKSATSDEMFTGQLKSLGLSPEEFQRRIMEQALAEVVLEREVKSKLTVTDAQVEEFYNTGTDVLVRILQAELERLARNTETTAEQLADVKKRIEEVKKSNLSRLEQPEILFYLDDADGSNGCLQVIPGRHLGPRLDHDHDGYFQGRVTTKIDESATVALDGKAGDVIFMHCMTPHASTTNKSLRFRRTLILSYRATDAFPIHVGETTLAAERFVRLVRGRQLHVARFSMKEFPVPVYRTRPASLYELQEQSRKEMTKAS